MKTIFYFFPHCYIKTTHDELLVYDTLRHKGIYYKNYNISSSDKETLSKGYIIDGNETKQLITSCESMGMGYFIDCKEMLPFLNERYLKITTSLEKEYRSLNHNLASYTNTLLKDITIFCNNSIDTGFPELAYLQIEYPDTNCQKIDYDFLLKQFIAFHDIECITLSGEIDELDFATISSYTQDNRITLIHRIFFETTSCEKILHDLEANDSLIVEVIVDRNSDLSKLFTHERLYVKALINDVRDISLFSELNNVIYVPIIPEIGSSKEMLEQMIVSKEEVLSTKASKRTCILSDYINIGAFGKIVINNDYRATCIGQEIGSLKETDLSNLINKWIRNDNCMWYYSRVKKVPCKNCALSALCPSINIYEMQGIYRCPCKEA